ncbi:MAG: hypothetical protein WCK87_00920 [Candidatus Saccharibacteria bacterium]|jgi:hypothetical protein|nr:hypothetical protein [Patescibacteria group bacterium]
MNGLEIALITILSIATLILIVYTVVFITIMVKVLKQVSLAAEKVQESADSAVELVDEVRRTVVNPGIIAMTIEKYLHTRSRAKKSGDDK